MPTPDDPNAVSFQYGATDVTSCFEACKTYPLVVFSPARQPYCACYTYQLEGNGEEVICDLYTSAYRFTHDPISQASSLARRRSSWDKLRDRSDSYEYLDVSFELESCGGCLNGEFLGNATLSGLDCSTLPGIAQNAVTCTAGQCVAYACRKGYNLVEGVCV
nr:uncharacterized protein CI109_002088 [Kwoniella shandongensis]KAA5529662.1 hypothetical protein CI109_002088 [Kwoniella shandongensis]